MKRVLKRLAGFCFILCIGAVPYAAAENMLPSFDEGVDRLSIQLMGAIANRYFDADKRPVIRVAVFDFTDAAGNVTVGSRYVSNRIRMAFAGGTQFDLLPLNALEIKNSVITDRTFSDNQTLRDYIVGRLKADVYLLGRMETPGETSLTCTVALWGTKTPFTDYSTPVLLTGDALKPEIPTACSWSLRLTPSGIRYFNRIKMAGAKTEAEQRTEEKLAPVIFLTQPLCDDLNLAWQVSADGMIYDVRKKRDLSSLRNRTGQIMQSRLKSTAALKELSYVIKNFTLTIREEGEGEGGKAYPLQPYVLPRESRYYFIPYLEGEKALRFVYLWNEPGKSKKPSSRDSGAGWSLFQAEADWPNMLPVGNHTATVTLSPIAETDYGTKRERAEYVTRFRFAVRPGLNIYVINYVYRMDRPEIFVRRLEVGGPEERDVGRVRSITEIFDVYGTTNRESDVRRQKSGDR
ncbi:MAG: hypothetical protein U5R49_19735 [Deltaproteobacteria bacterium]|nr:hypothetical protein [Deltaproteobacteria bacterium]